jgi:putative peptide zinc metalloprotease protein
MNLTKALNVALPEIPALSMAVRYPRLHPQVVFREHILDGKPIIRVVVPGEQGLYTFSREQWQIIELFNGQRSYDEIANLYCEKYGVRYSVEQVREMASDLEVSSFWYRTDQEKNVLLLQKSAEERRKLAKKGKTEWGDLSSIIFPAVNPDRFLEWLDKRAGFFYSWPGALLTMAGFATMFGVFIAHWNEVGRDTFLFFNFRHKTVLDIIGFWLLATVVMAIHEIGHGLTTKHFGGHVMSMGFALVYLTPAFYTDTSEGEVLGNRFQRIMITASGMWIETMLCTIATFIWWGSPPGVVHDAAYYIILITGVAGILINLNPLMKLDGYYIMTELLDMVDLKEDSTRYVSAWAKKYIWRLPVEVPYVARKRRISYAIYGILSGLYSYSVLYLFASFIGNVFRNFSPEWSFIPEFATAILIFKGRIRTLANFMKFVYLDKKDRLQSWFNARRSFMLSATAIVVLLLPVFHESAQGRFVLEAKDRAVLRAIVPGTVTEVHASESQSVVAGSVLVRLQNLPLQSQLARSASDFDVASARATSATLHYADLGAALQDREHLAEQVRTLEGAAQNLELRSPISGVVVTPRPADRMGAYVVAGTELVEVDDLTTLRARIYVSEHDIYKFHVGATARFVTDGSLRMWSAQATAIAPMSGATVPGLIDLSQYAGMTAPNFYVVDLLVSNLKNELRPGMIGTARIYGKRRSLAGLVGQETANFWKRKIW